MALSITSSLLSFTILCIADRFHLRATVDTMGLLASHRIPPLSDAITTSFPKPLTPRSPHSSPSCLHCLTTCCVW